MSELPQLPWSELVKTQAFQSLPDDKKAVAKQRYVDTYGPAIADHFAEQEGVDSQLFRRLVGQESAGKAGAVSNKGATGLAQLMPATAASLGVDPTDPDQNLAGGARYLKQQMETFGTPELALAAYNAGPGAVKKHGGIPPYKETQDYVRRIMGGVAQPIGGAPSGVEPAPGVKEKFGENVQVQYAPLSWDELIKTKAYQRLTPEQKAIAPQRFAELYGRSGMGQMLDETKGMSLPPSEIVQQKAYVPLIEAYSPTTARVIKDVMGGAVGSAKAMIAAEPWVESLTGIETPLGPLSKKAAEKLDRYAQSLMPDDPNFGDKLAAGFGSTLSFFVPGLGTQVAVAKLATAAPRIASWAGVGTMTAMEAAAEAGGLHEDLLKKGVAPEEAAATANKSFWQNVALLAVTNKLGGSLETGPLLKKMAKSGAMEGTQEAGQYDIERRAKGEPFDIKEAGEAAAIGAIVGPAMGAVLGQRGKQQPQQAGQQRPQAEPQQPVEPEFESGKFTQGTPPPGSKPDIEPEFRRAEVDPARLLQSAPPPESGSGTGAPPPPASPPPVQGDATYEAIVAQYQQTRKKPTVTSLQQDHGLDVRQATQVLNRMKADGLFAKPPVQKGTSATSEQKAPSLSPVQEGTPATGTPKGPEPSLSPVQEGTPATAPEQPATIRPEHIHAEADRHGIVWDNDPDFADFTEKLTGKRHLDDMTPGELDTVRQAIARGERPSVQKKTSTTATDPGQQEFSPTGLSQKEPWEMTAGELQEFYDSNREFAQKFEHKYAQSPVSNFGLGHKLFIEDAVKSGKQVPRKIQLEAGLLPRWQMTKREYVESRVNQAQSSGGIRQFGGETPQSAGGQGKKVSEDQAGEEHFRIVENALFQGKPVPTEVLVDYPDLDKNHPSVQQGQAATTANGPTTKETTPRAEGNSPQPLGLRQVAERDQQQEPARAGETKAEKQVIPVQEGEPATEEKPESLNGIPVARAGEDIRGKIVYHGTSEENARSIYESGKLNPERGKRQYDYSEAGPDVTFLSRKGSAWLAEKEAVAAGRMVHYPRSIAIRISEDANVFTVESAEDVKKLAQTVGLSFKEFERKWAADRLHEGYRPSDHQEALAISKQLRDAGIDIIDWRYEEPVGPGVPPKEEDAFRKWQEAYDRFKAETPRDKGGQQILVLNHDKVTPLREDGTPVPVQEGEPATTANGKQEEPPRQTAEPGTNESPVQEGTPATASSGKNLQVTPKQGVQSEEPPISSAPQSEPSPPAGEAPPTPPVQQGQAATASLMEEPLPKSLTALYARGLQEGLRSFREVGDAYEAIVDRLRDMHRAMQTGDLHSVDITSALAEAIDETASYVIRMNARTSPVPLDAYLAGRDGKGILPLAKEWMRVFDTYRKEQGGVTRFLTRFLDVVDAAGSPKQPSFFTREGNAPTIEEVLVATNKLIEREEHETQVRYRESVQSRRADESLRQETPTRPEPATTPEQTRPEDQVSAGEGDRPKETAQASADTTSEAVTPRAEGQSPQLAITGAYRAEAERGAAGKPISVQARAGMKRALGLDTLVGGKAVRFLGDKAVSQAYLKSLEPKAEEPTKTEEPPQPEKPTPAEKPELKTSDLASLSDDELSTLFDEVEGELQTQSEPVVEKTTPIEKPQRAPRQTEQPRRPRQPREQRPSASENPQKAADYVKKVAKEVGTAAAEGAEGVYKLFAGKNRLGSGLTFDEETYRQAKPHFQKMYNGFVEAGKTLKEFIAYLINDFGANIKPYLMRFAQDLRAEQGGQGVTNRGQLQEHTSPDDQGAQRATQVTANWVADKLRAGQPFSSALLFERMSQAYGGKTMAEGAFTPKDAYDAVELGVNQYLISEKEKPEGTLRHAEQTVEGLKKLQSLLPTPTKRTEEQDEFQQFSTPPHLAYAAAWAANIDPNDVVLEPSAGIGGLATFAKNIGAQTVVNELSPRRAVILKQMGFDRVFTENAEQLNNVLPRDIQPTVILMNPPFSSTAGRMEGQRKTMNGAKHIEQALARLVPNGRLVAIVGRGMAEGTPTFSDWWKKIKSQYNVRANIGLSGEEYKKYGTTFDNQLLVIDKTGPTTQPTIKGKLDTVKDALVFLEGIRNDRQREGLSGSAGAEQRPTQSTRQESPSQKEGTGITESGTPVSTPGVRSGTQVGAVSEGTRTPGELREPVGNAGERTVGVEAPGGTSTGGTPESAGTTRNDERTGTRAGSTEQSTSDTGPSVPKTEQPDLEKPTELTDSVFDRYRPQNTFANAKEHPGNLVETAAMHAVSLPKLTYKHHLPESIIKEGRLSDAQLEAISYAGQAHSRTLTNGNTRGFFIGDGTGVGKGREISGIILDNWHQGRQKAVWISLNPRLMDDAKRDFGGAGGDAEMVFPAPGTRVEIKNEKGVLFTTYTSLSQGYQRAKIQQAGGATSSQFNPGDIVAYVQGRAGTTVDDEVANEANHWQITGEPKQKRGGYFYRAKNLSTGVKGDIPGSSLQMVKASGVSPKQSRLEQIVKWLGPEFDGVIAFDECVPAGTLIDTPTGPRAIETLKIGDSVWGFDHAIGRMVPALVKWTFRRQTTSPLHQIGPVKMTGNHPVWTENRGYVPASHVVLSDQVRYATQYGQSTVRVLRDGISEKQKTAAILQQGLRGKGDGNTVEFPIPLVSNERGIETAIQGSKQGPSIASAAYDNLPEGTCRVSPVRQEPLSESCCYQESENGLLSSYWGQREAIAGSAPAISGTIVGLENRVSGWSCSDTGRVSTVLSNRPSVSAVENRGGSGWREPSFANTAKKRCEEDGLLATGGMDGAAFLEFGNPQEDGPSACQDQCSIEVFNIETESANYFANGLLVHNCHKMGNAVAQKGTRGSKQPSQVAQAGVELQKQLPKARIVYVSATGASNVSNLAYAPRLGLWGEGTPFPDVNDFIEEIGSGGVAAMELIAQNLKAMGSYLARSLDYSEVTYRSLEHPLTPQQTEMYNELANFWQQVFANVNRALVQTEADNNAKRSAMSAFGGAQQRFFDAVITGMQMPSVIADVRKDLEDGRAPVLQIVNTNEAILNRQIEKMEDDDPEAEAALDLTPRDILAGYLEKSFPTEQYEEYIDEEGNPGKRLVLDSEGKPVENAEAVAMREEALDRLGGLKIPQGALDQIINAFGAEDVAEVTGRIKRVVDGKVETREAHAAKADGNAFMEDRKKLLIFSKAGGTGATYNASRDAKNQRKRTHYLVQAGWTSEDAIQGFGRTHRTNQVSAPEYVMVTTDLPGQKRFISTIARRLGQLGALTRGQRQATSQGMLSEKDNLENGYAELAVKQLFRDAASGAAPVSLEELGTQMGLPLMDDDGDLRDDAIPDVKKFLNRMLMLTPEMQREVFGAFKERMDRNIDAATARGTLDTGMETIRGLSIRVADQVPLYTDPETGAVTVLTDLSVERKRTIVSWEDIAKEKLRNPNAEFFRNTKSGRLSLVIQMADYTDPDTGEVERQFLSKGPSSTSIINQKSFGNLEHVPEQNAQAEWEKQVSELSPTVTTTEHLVVGSILPIWKRLKGHPRIVRAQTDDGQRFIGRRIPPGQIDRVKENFGLGTEGQKQEKASPQQAVAQVLDSNAKVTLSNGWTLKRSRVAGEYRLELDGPDLADRATLAKHGGYTERIGYQLRYFLRRGSTAGEDFANLLRGTASDIVRVTVPEESRTTLDETGAITIPAEAIRKLQSLVARAEQILRGKRPLTGKDRAEMATALGVQGKSLPQKVMDFVREFLRQARAILTSQRGNIPLPGRQKFTPKPATQQQEESEGGPGQYGPKGKLKHFGGTEREQYQAYLGQERGSQAADILQRYKTRIALSDLDIYTLMAEKLTDEQTWETLKRIPYLRPARLSNFLRSFTKWGKQFGVTRDRQEVLFNAAEAIKELDDEGNPVFGTRVYARDPNTHEPLLDENGNKIDLGWRFTPEEGEEIWSGLSQREKDAVLFWVAERESIKQAAGILSDIEGYIHHFRDRGLLKGFRSMFRKMGKYRLKKSTADARKFRSEADGFVRDFERAIVKGWSGINHEILWNDTLKQLIPLITDPVIDGKVHKDWQVIPRGELSRQEKFIGQLAGGRQIPTELYKEFIRYIEPINEQMTMLDHIRQLAQYMAGNLLINFGTFVGNALGSGIQFATYLTETTMKSMLTGNVKPLFKAVMSPLEALRPSVVQEVSRELLGGHSGILTQYGIKGLGDRINEVVLWPMGAIDTYVKRVIAVSELKAQGVPIDRDEIMKAEKEYDAMRKAVDTWGLDYEQIPRWLKKFRNSPIGPLVSFYVTFSYKIARMMGRYIGAMNPGVTMEPDPRYTIGSKRERLARLLTLGAIYGLMMSLFPEDEEKVGPGLEGLPKSIDKSQRVKVGETEIGDERYLRVSNYTWVQFLGLIRATKNWWTQGISPGEDVKEIIDALTPSMGILPQVMVLGHEYFKQGQTPGGVAVAKALKPAIPFGRFSDEWKKGYGGPLVKSQTFAQEMGNMLPLPRDIVRKYAGIGRIVEDPVTKKPVIINPTLANIKFWTGLNMIDIDPGMYDRFVHGKIDERKKKLDAAMRKINEAKSMDEIDAAFRGLKKVAPDVAAQVAEKIETGRIRIDERKLKILEQLEEQTIKDFTVPGEEREALQEE